ncbi:MAG: PAS domain-containing protein [Alphaproteobacteria bacterium]|nr:PAS domain-containing protein [Alphaproteobacteria bacterium]
MTDIASAADLPLTDRERNFLAYWDSLRAGNDVPERSRILPENLGPWLGWLHLLEVLDDGGDFLYRVHGTEASALTSTRYHLKRVSEAREPFRSRGFKLYGLAAAQAQPVFLCESEDFGESGHRTFSRVVVPFGSPGSKGPSHLLALLTNRVSPESQDTVVIGQPFA